jgi:hypothetical protein
MGGVDGIKNYQVWISDAELSHLKPRQELLLNLPKENIPQ